MKSSKLNEALGYVDDRYLNMADNTPKEVIHLKSQYHTKTYKRIIAVAAAVAVFLALGVVAYAADLFGVRALLRPQKAAWEGTEYNVLSLTQPQDVPEGLDPAISEKVANNKAAWAEWELYRQSVGADKKLPLPAAYGYVPEGAFWIAYEENEDGTGTLYWSMEKEDGSNTPMGEIALTAEEYAELVHFDMVMESVDLPGYVGYGVYTEEDAVRLEEIAAKYGLAIKRERHLAWSSDSTGQTGANFHSNEELAEMTAQIGCAGNIFHTTPAGFDKVYWFGEGTFAISYDVNLSTGKQAACYGYNSMYATLSSGTEVVNWETDLSAFAQRLHTTPDGTEVTILSNGADAYIYVYLENSFFAEHITCEAGLTDADLDAIADGLQYSLIGK